MCPSQRNLTILPLDNVTELCILLLEWLAVAGKDAAVGVVSQLAVVGGECLEVGSEGYWARFAVVENTRLKRNGETMFLIIQGLREILANEMRGVKSLYSDGDRP